MDAWLAQLTRSLNVHDYVVFTLNADFSLNDFESATDLCVFDPIPDGVEQKFQLQFMFCR